MILNDIHKLSTEEALAHFGTKGMKWGVRKAETASDRRDAAPFRKRFAEEAKWKIQKKLDASAVRGDVISKDDKKLAKANMRKAFGEIGEIRMQQYFNPTGMSPKTYASLSTEEVKIAKGAEFARVTTRKNEALKDLTYVSRTKEDQELYRAIMTDMGGKRKQQFEYTFKTTMDLKGPSEKARVDAFTELLDTKSIPYGKNKTITGKEYLKKIGYKKEVKRLDTQQLGLRFYEDLISQAGVMGSPIGTAYFNNIASKGYNMLADDNDRKILSRDPLIILKPNGSLEQTSVKQLTRREIVEATKNFKTALAPD